MRLILNVIWLVLCGWWMAILYVLAGIICCHPDHHDPVRDRVASGSRRTCSGRSAGPSRCAATPGIGSLIGNIIWIILVGWELALGHLTAGILLCITIIGIPLGLANFKLIPISLLPLGVRIVRVGRALPRLHGAVSAPAR